MLGLRVVGASPDRPLGWDVLRSTGDEAVLGNRGVLGTARIVASSTPDRVVLTTLIHLGPAGRPLWAVAAPVHRAVARQALGALAEPVPHGGAG